MLIYIRHSEDTTDTTHKHDPKLTRRGKKLAYMKGHRLIKRYGYPTVIYCSPFRRTRQTLKYMLSGINTENIKIIYDPNISRYFSNEEKKEADVAKSTMIANIPIYEDYNEFGKRMLSVCETLSGWIKEREIVWCITHTTVYKRIANIYDIKYPEYILPMDYFILRSSENRKWCPRCKKYHILKQ
jgi:broad specificity phosphatase PhoE